MVPNHAEHYILNLFSPTPKLVSNEAKLAIIQTRIVFSAVDYEQTTKCK